MTAGLIRSLLTALESNRTRRSEAHRSTGVRLLSTASATWPVTGRRRGPLDAYSRDLDAHLRGPRRLRRDLVAEARGGLADAADDLAACGLPREEAERTAVAEFGPVRELAPQFQERLTVAEGRRTGVVLAVTYPALLLAWDLLWRGVETSVAPSPQTPVSILVVDLARLNDWVTLLVAVTGAVALLLLQGRMHRLVPPRRVVAVLGAMLLAGLVVSMTACLTMTVLNPVDSARAASGSAFGMFVNAASYLTNGWLGYAAVRSLRSSVRYCPAVPDPTP